MTRTFRHTSFRRGNSSVSLTQQPEGARFLPERGERERVARHVSALLPDGERRRAERRRRERRYAVAHVEVDRRLVRDRRSALQRRESARGHLFNVAQLLTLASADPISADDLVQGALRRVWLALREMELGNVGGAYRRSESQRG